MTDIYECRVCFCEGSDPNDFISPCCCIGSALHIHKSCLNKWLLSNHGTQNYFTCKECNCKYKRTEPSSKEYLINKDITLGSLLTISISSVILIVLIIGCGLSKMFANIVLILLYLITVFYMSLNNNTYGYFLAVFLLIAGLYSGMKIKTFITDIWLILGFLIFSIYSINDYWESLKVIIEKSHLYKFKPDMYDNFLKKYVSGIV